LILQGNIDLRFDTILQDLSLFGLGQPDAIMRAVIFLKLTKGKQP